MALSLDGTTGISASGNIWGNNIIVPGTLSVGVFNPSSVSASGNVTGGNILTAGVVSATGNITGAYILGNGSQLTGVDATQIINGTSNAKVVSSGGNIAVGIGGTSNVAVFATTGAFITGVNSVSGNITGGNILTAGAVSATGNITGQNINSANADLAEMYVADQPYAPGTVVEFGGDHEITATTQSHSTRVAGVISTAPSYIMNTEQTGEHVLPVALTGRVPCLVLGPITKGDRLVASNTKGTAVALDSTQYQPGCIIGKALENYNSDQVGTIEIVVGRT